MSSRDIKDPQVIEGNDGWLYLKEGTNQSWSYLTGQLPVDPRVELQWRRTIHRRAAMFPGCLHLICPEKLAVFPEHVACFQLDAKRLGRRLANVDGVLYPVQALHAKQVKGAYSYSKTDTHFSDLGALIAAKAVARHFAVNPQIEAAWSLQRIAGDLGSKLTPVVQSDKLVLTTPLPITVQDNGLTNRGRMITFSNPQAAGGRLLVFGDSFSGINLGRMLSAFFKEVLFVHSLAADYRVIAQFAPDHILFEFAERFLRDVPADGLSVESLIIQKLIEGSGAAVQAWQNDRSNSTHRFVDWDVVKYYAQEYF